MSKLLTEDFYKGFDVVDISKNLLGKVIVTEFKGKRTTGRIVETEAYKAPEDKACHAWNNRRTPRTETMFARGGVAYVYICYGIHHLFNVVTGPEDYAHAVLIRGIEPIDGIDHMLERRKFSRLIPELTNGPGKLSVALGIDNSHDGYSLYQPGGPIAIEDSGISLENKEIISGPRVGMSTAEECSNWPWRFRVRNNKWSSKPDKVYYSDWPKSGDLV